MQSPCRGEAGPPDRTQNPSSTYGEEARAIAEGAGQWPGGRRAPDEPAQEAAAAATQAASATPAGTAAADNDAIAKLERLARLHESGALSDEEFAAAKARVLGVDAEHVEDEQSED